MFAFQLNNLGSLRTSLAKSQTITAKREVNETYFYPNKVQYFSCLVLYIRTIDLITL